ncbi:hypothetical protein F4823DRAFT_569940 [Ustulina deusta]|nr:hypothetical protein F4823DRAFT_569940 [Ustulina deusta]
MQIAFELYAGDSLAKESRANYRKLVTIEPNGGVFFLGTVVSKDFDSVTWAADKCWNEKKCTGPRGQCLKTKGTAI